jgi:hypothetical protein
LGRNKLFKRALRSPIERSSSSEGSLLKNISNQVGAKGAANDRDPAPPFAEGNDE